ncbi:hypothetical protein [Mycoplana sp. MJR14]|uniref:hypothetical protein n=1 Tax=Mycoplana sp. MJR14 TaxID=3032583 RepID=UPI0023D9D07D|nr:hypothetical protein [Mycoplana sp. MJR14]MDF1633279.1 hypothetical protein [Mycoplana sp. MJR14]
MLATLEWQWSLWNLAKGSGIVGSFALPAWAVYATDLFARYQPLSWVVAGFAGVLTTAVAYAIFARARASLIRSAYDNNLYQRSGFVDPMAATFENKRIFLADFVLPSDLFISDKTFINCEIVGPANLFLRGNYQVHEQLLTMVDAVMLNGDRNFNNGVIVENCTFRKCSFKRITLMMLPHEYERYKNLDWLHWISRPGDRQEELPGVLTVEQAEQPLT